MKEKLKPGHVQLTAILIAIANIFTGFATPVANSYTVYSWTDLNGLDQNLYAKCMSGVGVLLTIIAIVSGVIVTKTRTRWG